MKATRALRTLRRLKGEAANLSAWEGAFLDSVEGRIGQYGRAFADPEKGARDSAVSVLQSRKLKEIAAKAAGEASPPLAHKGLTRKSVTRKGLARKGPMRKGLMRHKPLAPRTHGR